MARAVADTELATFVSVVDVSEVSLEAMGIRDRPSSARSPWQNGHAERLIGSIRRDCLDHVVVFGERLLRHLLNSYQRYYNEVSHAPIAAERCAYPACRSPIGHFLLFAGPSAFSMTCITGKSAFSFLRHSDLSFSYSSSVLAALKWCFLAFHDNSH